MGNRLYYLDYILYTILILLSYILILKILNTREGFEHKGNSFIANTNKNKNKKHNARQPESILIKILKPVYKFLNVIAMALIKIPSKYLFSFGAQFQDIFDAMAEYGNAQLLMSQKMIKDIFNKYKNIFPDLGDSIREVPGIISRSIRERTDKITRKL